MTFISDRNKKNENNLKKYFLFLLIVVVKVKKLSFFKKKKYDACAVGAPYFSKSLGATFQSYFREDKKFTSTTLRFSEEKSRRITYQGVVFEQT